MSDGKRRVTPYWRTIRDNGCLNPKFPGGVAAHAKRLRAEALVVERTTGKQPLRVKDYERALRML